MRRRPRSQARRPPPTPAPRAPDPARGRVASLEPQRRCRLRCGARVRRSCVPPAAVAARLARSSRSCACACARCSIRRARSADGPLELGGRRRGDTCSQALELAIEPVERFLQVLDLDVLGDDRPEREARDGVPSRRAATAKRHGGRSVGAGGVLHGDDVAPEVAGDGESALGRLRQRVGVLDRERRGWRHSAGPDQSRAGRRLLRGVHGSRRPDQGGRVPFAGRALDGARRRRGITTETRLGPGHADRD